MMWNKEIKLLIVGLGLMGGSYAKALSAQGYTVSAISPVQADLDFALERGWIVKGATSPTPDLIAEADLTVLALYPHLVKEWVEANQVHFHAGAFLTDVTGVKGSIVDAVQAILRPDLEFISAHPMAGRELSGVQNSDETMFRNANYVITPTEKNTEEGIALCRALGETLGFAQISMLTPEAHDEIIAFVSQLTHCIAISLMTCQPTEHLEDYTGDSFRDLTRIARINDEMWSELFLANRDPLLHQMTLFEGELRRLRLLLEVRDREGLREMMRYSTKRRALFDKKL